MSKVYDFSLGFAWEIEAVFLMFERLSKDREPDQVTLLNILNVCSHASFVGKGQYFEVMSWTHKIANPWALHLLEWSIWPSRSVKQRSNSKDDVSPPDVSLWHTLFSLCRNWANPVLGREDFENAMRSGEIDATSYISLQTILWKMALLWVRWGKGRLTRKSSQI